MSLNDIRKRYQPAAADQSELVKRLQAENAQQKRDIIQLLAEIDRLNTGKPPGPELEPGAEDAVIAAELEQAGIPKDYVPQGPSTPSREAENTAANIAAGRAHPTFATARGEPIEAHAFDEEYQGRR